MGFAGLCKLGVLVLFMVNTSLVLGGDIWDAGSHDVDDDHDHNKWDVYNVTDVTDVWDSNFNETEIDLFHELQKFVAISVRNQSEILKAVQNQMNNSRHALREKLAVLEHLVRGNSLAISRLAEGAAARNHTVPKPECPVSFKKFNNSCYFFGFMPVNRPKAKRICEQMDSYLVEVESYAEDQYLISRLHALESWFSPRGFFTGLTDSRREGHWVWETSGRSLGYSNWYGREGRRKYSNREDYMVYWREDSFLWHDWIDNEDGGFICEYDL